MMSPEERIASLDAFRIAHDGRHDSFEKMLNLRFDDLNEKLDGIEKRVFPLLHAHNPGNPGNGKNGWAQKEIVVKVVFPSAGIGAGIVSVLYWVSQVIGK